MKQQNNDNDILFYITYFLKRIQELCITILRRKNPSGEVHIRQDIKITKNKKDSHWKTSKTHTQPQKGRKLAHRIVSDYDGVVHDDKDYNKKRNQIENI